MKINQIILAELLTIGGIVVLVLTGFGEKIIPFFIKAIKTPNPIKTTEEIITIAAIAPPPNP